MFQDKQDKKDMSQIFTESNLCNHGNNPNTCQICQKEKRGETRPDTPTEKERYAALDHAHEVVRVKKNQYHKIKNQYDDVRNRMSAALERRNEILAQVEANIDQPGAEEDEILKKEIEIADLEARLQMEERDLFDKLQRAMDEWMLALQEAQDAYIQVIDPEASTMKIWLETFYQKRLFTRLDTPTLKKAGYQFESLQEGLTSEQVRDLIRKRTNKMEDIILFEDGTIAFRKPIHETQRDALVREGYEIIKAQKNPITRRQQLDVCITHGDDIYLTEDGYWVIKRVEEKQA